MTYVLIPGAGGSAWYWHLVEPRLRARGHDVVSVELPADDESAGLAEYTDTVVEAVGGRTDLVVVAQSLGGFTGPLVCGRLPVQLLVLLNAMTPRPGESPGDWWTTTGQLTAVQEQGEHSWSWDDGFDPERVFLHDVPPEVATAGAAHQREQSDAPFGAPWPLSAWPDVPTRFLAARGDRFFPIAFQRRVVHERLGIAVDEMDGGHLVALSRPDELVERLEAYRTALA
ncbi:MAG: alpha/beta hydrolase [Actinomycetota bacterium]|nr:alpha/beta hydrolase [Actinomycetota bacterium]